MSAGNILMVHREVFTLSHTLLAGAWVSLAADRQAEATLAWYKGFYSCSFLFKTTRHEVCLQQTCYAT